MSDVAVEWVGMAARVKFGDSMLNSHRTRYTHCCALFNCLLFSTEEASGAISGRFVGLTASDEHVQFRDPRLNRYGEIRPKTVGVGIFDSFFSR